MDNDDDGRRPRGRMMTDDDRALIGAKRRALRPAPPVSAAPATRPPPADQSWDLDDEITHPERVIERGLTELELELLAKVGIEAGSAATMGDVVKLMLRDYRRQREHNSGSKELGKQLDELRRLLETPPNALSASMKHSIDTLKNDVAALSSDVSKFDGANDDRCVALQAEVDALNGSIVELRAANALNSRRLTELRDGAAKQRRALKWLRGVAVTAAVAAVGSIGTAAAKIYQLGEQEGEAAIRLSHAERDLAEIHQDLRSRAAVQTKP